MREFTVRAYEDHWLVREEGGGEEKVVEGQQALTEALAWRPAATRPTVARKPRTRRTKEQIAAAKAAKEAAEVAQA